MVPVATPKRGGIMVTIEGSLEKFIHRRAAPVPSSGVTGQAESAKLLVFLLFADPRGIGFAFHSLLPDCAL